MREISEIRFSTDGEAENRELIEHYVLDAVERLPQSECCEYAAFMPLTHDEVDGGNVWMTIAGDIDALTDQESTNWDALVEDGFASEWDVTPVTETWYENGGERGGELLLQLHRLANQTTKAIFEDLETSPAAVDTYPEEDSKHPIGLWTILDIASGHLEYSFDEIVAMYLQGIQNEFKTIAELESSEEAIQQLDECIRSLETLRNDIED